MIDLTGYKLTFDDEFNQRSISQSGGTTWSDIRSEWRLDANSDIGFGHSSFVDPASGYDPFHVANGALTITAVPDRTASGYPGSWESGLITTQGTFSQTYGYFEMRADLSETPGAWDAFWMLPDKAINASPQSWQELDIVEHYGVDPASTYRWIHTTDPSNNVNAERQVTTANPEQASGYHTYGMDWQADRIGFYFDGQYMGSQATPSDMHGPMYLLANLATQGNEQGSSMAMSIDYIRAYSADAHATAVTPGAVSAPDGHDPGFYGATIGGGTPAVTPATDAHTTPTPTEAPAASAPIEASAPPQTPNEPSTPVASTGPDAAPIASPPIDPAPVNANPPSHADAGAPANDPPATAPVEASAPPANTPVAADTPATAAPAPAEVVQSPNAPESDNNTPTHVATPAHGCGRGHAHAPSDAAFDFAPVAHDWHHGMHHHAHHHDWTV